MSSPYTRAHPYVGGNDGKLKRAHAYTRMKAVISLKGESAFKKIQKGRSLPLTFLTIKKMAA